MSISERVEGGLRYSVGFGGGAGSQLLGRNWARKEGGRGGNPGLHGSHREGEVSSGSKRRVGKGRRQGKNLGQIRGSGN